MFNLFPFTLVFTMKTYCNICNCNVSLVLKNYSIPPVSAGDTFQDLPRMPETADSSEPYIYISRFSFTYIPVIKFN
jgi:hypothetical protein